MEKPITSRKRSLDVPAEEEERSRATRPRIAQRINVLDPAKDPDFDATDMTTFLVSGLLVQVFSNLLAKIGTLSQTGKLVKTFRDVSLVQFMTVLVTLLGPEVEPPACLSRETDNTPVPPKVWQDLVKFLSVENFQGLIDGINSGFPLCMYAVVALPPTSLPAIKVTTSRSIVMYYYHNPGYTDDSWLSNTFS